MLRKRTEAELQAAIEANEPSRNLRSEIRRDMEDTQREARRELNTGVFERKITPLGLIHPIFFMMVLTFNEVYLLGNSGLPPGEKPFAVGQWGPWVGVALTLIAAAIVKYKEPEFLKR